MSTDINLNVDDLLEIFEKAAFHQTYKMRDGVEAVAAAVISAQLPATWRAAMQEFVDRCERGEIRSRYSYAKFKALLAGAPVTQQPESRRGLETHEMCSAYDTSGKLREPESEPCQVVGRVHHRHTGVGACLNSIGRQLPDNAPLYTSPQPSAQVDRKQLRKLVEGMSVSVDVSTCDEDAGHRYFGTVTVAQDDDDGKHGLTLLVQDAEPNFERQPSAQVPDIEGLKAKLENVLKVHRCVMTSAGIACIEEVYRALCASPPAAAAQVPEEWRLTIGEAINIATVLDDGGDGADGESARRIISLLKGLLTAAPSVTEERQPDSVSAFLNAAEELIDSHPYLYVELARTRTTDWMAWLREKPGDGGRLLSNGQGSTAEEACQLALDGLERPDPPEVQ